MSPDFYQGKINWRLASPEDAGLLSRGEAQQSLQPVLTEEPLVGAQTEAEAD